jgi:hypothetical protein
MVLILIVSGHRLSGQSTQSAENKVKEERTKFVKTLIAVSIDTAIVYPLAHSIESEVTSIYTFIRNNASLSSLEKEKAVRSLVYFIKELNRNLAEKKLDIYSIPGAFYSYTNLLKAVLSHKPLAPILEPMEPIPSQLMAISFSQYKEYSLLDDIAIYKRVSSSPEFILQFLENKPGFRFADSLLLRAAAHDPLKLIYYLNHVESGVQDKIRNTKNIYLQQIATLSDDKQASELLPFVSQIAEKKITTEEILETRTEATKYFQLLVNELQSSIASGDGNAIFIKPLRSGIKQKALAFYVNEINELHASGESTRFASVKGLRPQDLYYIITSCGEELYTSSYLGLYKRLMDQLKNDQPDSLFDLMQYDNFRVFVRLAANYNVIDDFLHRLSPQKMKEVLHLFISGIEKEEITALEKAMDIADSFTSLSTNTETREIIQNELGANLDRCKAGQQYLGIRLYSILSDIFSLVNQTEGIERLWSTLGDYEVLKQTALQNEKGEIVELVLFYGDEDGVASFNNFLRSYTDKNKWQVSKTENWVSIRSLSGRPLVIYANLPLDIRQEMDLKAQDSLSAFLTGQSLNPVVLVHRGHSYHLDKTLKRLKPSVKLAILGSCGGYNKAISIANINPGVQVIGSKKTGAKSINDPILDVINETLVSDKDLLWPQIWDQLSARFKKDENALDLFNEYFPPSHNLSLFVLKLFRSNTR